MEEATKLTEKQEELTTYIRNNIQDNRLNLRKKNITNEDLAVIIPEIKKMKNLKKLNLSQNLLTSISCLSNLPNLEDLYLDKNQLTSIDGLSSLWSLVYLNLIQNQITSIDGLSSLWNLKTLHLDQNQLTSVDKLSSLSCLVALSISQNQITSINGFSNLSHLEYLYLGKNQLTSINDLFLERLKILSIEECQVTQVDNVMLPRNATINMQNNLFTSGLPSNVINEINENIYRHLSSNERTVYFNRYHETINKLDYNNFKASINPENDVNIAEILNNPQNSNLLRKLSQMKIMDVSSNTREQTINEIKNILKVATIDNDLREYVTSASLALGGDCPDAAYNLFEQLKLMCGVKNFPSLNEKQKFDILIEHLVSSKIANALSCEKTSGDGISNQAVMYNKIAEKINQDKFFKLKLKSILYANIVTCHILEEGRHGYYNITKGQVNKNYQLFDLATRDFVKDGTETINLKDKDGNSVGTFIDFNKIVFDRDKIISSCVAANKEHFEKLTKEAQDVCLDCPEQYEKILSLLFQKKYFEQSMSEEGADVPKLKTKVESMEEKLFNIIKGNTQQSVVNEAQEKPSNTGKSLTNQKTM